MATPTATPSAATDKEKKGTKKEISIAMQVILIIIMMYHSIPTNSRLQKFRQFFLRAVILNELIREAKNNTTLKTFYN